MMRARMSWILPLLAAAVAAPRPAAAHCDTLDGPVVTAARAALDDGKLAPVLAWVRPSDEGEVRAAFASARGVRKAGGDARALADRWFFETVVRLHRAGEAAPYTGLAPAGTVEPPVAAADRAIARHDAGALEDLLVTAVRRGLRAHLAALEKERPPADDVTAGRRWVAAYVPFVHWAEGVHAAAASAAGGHGHGHAGEAGAAPEHAGKPAHEPPAHAHH